MLIYIVIIFLCHLDGINSKEYYVIPSDGDRSSCPSGVECHTLSHYANYSRNNKFPSKVTFVFFKGQHELHDHYLYIHGLYEVTLMRHKSSAIESTVVRCYNSAYIHFRYVTKVQIDGLTLSNCTFQNYGKWSKSTVSIIQSSFKETPVIMTCGTVTLHNTFHHGGAFHFNCKFVKIYSSHIINNYFPKFSTTFLKITDSTFDNSRVLAWLQNSQNPKRVGHLEICNSIIKNNILRSDRKQHLTAFTIQCLQRHVKIFMSNITIANNSMTGMLIDGCYVIFQKPPSVFANNHSPAIGGGMWLSSRSIITSEGNTTVSFINNTAEIYGGAIYIEMDGSTLQNVNRTLPYCSLSHLRPIFTNNFASIAGDNVYGGFYQYSCLKPFNGAYGHSWPTSYINLTDCTKSPLLKHIPRPISSYISTDPLFVCLCTDINTTDCSKRTLDKEIYPGQNITLSLVTVGQCGGTSPSGLDVSGSNGIKVATYSNQRTGKVCQNFTYGINEYATNTISSQLTITLIRSSMSVTVVNYYYPSFSPSLVINIQFFPCPFGLKLHHSKGICVCNDVLTKLEGITCNVSHVSHPISRSGNNWLYYSHQDNCTVAYTNCPFDYCNMSIVHLNLNQFDLQCTHNRSGILCGQCQEGQSVMLGSNQCGYCGNEFLSLIIVFIVAGFLLVLLLLTSNLTISTGSINGLLFYANIIKLNQAVLFNGTSIPVLTQFISWINLDLGIETCFYNGLDDYVKTWLQFIFPVYIWLLTIFIIIGSHYSVRISRYCGNNSVPVLATLIVMSFTKLSRNITAVLMISPIKCDEKDWKSLWSVDGNIEYLTGRHIPLFLVSLIFLLIGLIYTVMIFSSQWLQRYGGRYCRSSLDPYVKLKPFIDAHTGPYKDKYRFWTGLLLIIRFILTGVFSYTTGISPQVNNYVIAIICCIPLFCMSKGIYNNMINTVLETFYMSNLFLTSLLSALSDHLSLPINVYINIISIGLSLVIFCGIVIVEVCVIIKKKCGMKFRKKQSQLQNNEEQLQLLPVESSSDDDDEEEYSPARVINRREPMIFFS